MLGNGVHVMNILVSRAWLRGCKGFEHEFSCASALLASMRLNLRGSLGLLLVTSAAGAKVSAEQGHLGFALGLAEKPG